MNHDTRVKLTAVAGANAATWATHEIAQWFAMALSAVSIIWIVTQWLKFVINWIREQRARRAKE